MSTSIRVLTTLTLVSLLLVSCGGSSSSNSANARGSFAGANGSFNWGEVGPGTGVPTDFVPGGGGTPTPPPGKLYDEFFYVLNPPDRGGGNVLTLGRNPDGSLEFIEAIESGVSRPLSIAIHPNGRNLYTLDLSTDSLRTYAINQTTGRLTPVGSEVGNLPNAQAVAVSRNGNYVFVSNPRPVFPAASDPPSNISTYSVGSDGGLTALGTPIDVPSRYYGLEQSPDGRFIYGMGSYPSSIGIFAVDLDTGALESEGDITPEGGRPFTMAFSPSGELAFVGYGDDRFVSSYGVDLSSGALSLLGNTPTENLSFSAVVHPTLPVFYTTEYQGIIETFSYDASGVATRMGDPVVFPGLGGHLGLSSNANFAYFTNYFTDEIVGFSVGTDGALTEINSYDETDFNDLESPRTIVGVPSTNNKVMEEKEKVAP